MSNGTQEVTFTPNHVPAPACYPSDFNALLDALTTGGGLSGTIPTNSGGGIYVGSAPPASSLTNKVWFKTDAAGRPLGIFMFYNGNWRKVYTGVMLYEVRFYYGPVSVFDGTGRGIIGGDADGWALCNGNNYTPNLQNYFVVASNQSVDGGWQANPSGLANGFSGGQGSFQIKCPNLPDLWALSRVRTVQSGSDANCLTIDAGPPVDLQIEDLVNQCQPSGQQAIDNTPPWVAMAPIMFVGYG
jgi:hypothetical protein